ncbi:hypothetical protein [Sciscionella sediminilitoris]|uniref:hypothetical protein n=1 Tax=Sciscionella sediminilitoris TaxID=1445613 RepID=UPI0012E14202|nr:hypothetical protein [Sciscionella sp. SE31]
MGEASKTLESGIRAVRKNAKRAERKLAEHGLDPAQLSDTVTAGAEFAREELVATTRRTQDLLARAGERTRKQATKEANHVGKKAEATLTKAEKKAKQKADKTAAKLAKKGKQVEQVAGEVATKVEKKLNAKLDKKAAKAEKKSAKKEGKRRRWPLVVGLAVVGAGVTYAVRAKSAQQVALDQDLPASKPTPVPSPQPTASKPAPAKPSQDSAEQAKPAPKAEAKPESKSAETKPASGQDEPSGQHALRNGNATAPKKEN